MIMSVMSPGWNLRWLAGYRHRRYDHPDRADQLRRAFALPAALMQGVSAVGDPLGVLPVLFHLLWRRELETDLQSAPLGEGSVVRVAGVSGDGVAAAGVARRR
jgi:hypothetical protein